jgi:hypothetical protein
LDEAGRKQAHVASEANKIDSMFVERRYEMLVKDFARDAFGGHGERSEPMLAGVVQTRCTRDVGNDADDFRVEAAFEDRLMDGLEV